MKEDVLALIHELAYNSVSGKGASHDTTLKLIIGICRGALEMDKNNKNKEASP